MLKTDRVDIEIDGASREFVVLRTKGQDIGLHMRNAHPPTFEIPTSSRPGEGIGLSETRIALYTKEEASIELVGLNGIGCICLISNQSHTAYRPEDQVADLHICSELGGRGESECWQEPRQSQLVRKCFDCSLVRQALSEQDLISVSL